MKNEIKSPPRDKEMHEDYQEIMKSTNDKTIVILTEWSKTGDYFHQLSMYDETYIPVQSFGNTTLIDAI